MSHYITAIILKGHFHSKEAKLYDLLPVSLTDDLTLFHIDHYYTAFWQNKLQVTGVLEMNDFPQNIVPNEKVMLALLQKITGKAEPFFAVMTTDYFGGKGSQAATVFKGDKNLNLKIKTINQALKLLGVQKKGETDEFELVGLPHIRRQPKILNKYRKLG